MALVLGMALHAMAMVTAVMARPEHPHIVMVMGDDIGFANVGWNRAVPTPEVQTPHMDFMVSEGIQLTGFYSFKYCSPTRSAFLSGRNPIHVNVVNGQTTCHNPADNVSGFSGIPVPMTGIAEKLGAIGYAAHAVGKWDAGMATIHHTPAGRGFQSWLGYFGHCNDYWTEIDKCGMQTCPDPANPNSTVQMVDLWEQSANGTVSRPASELNNSQTCSQTNQQGNGLAPPCHFEDDVFLHRVKSIIVTHATTAPATQPLFLYWAAHACHGPREVPAVNYSRFDFMNPNNDAVDASRQMYHALATYLDGMVGEVQTLLVEHSMWQDTIVVFSSDNGGDGQANNYPHRGAKFSNWEGGIHVPAFVSGGALPPSRRGVKVSALAAVWDLYATFQAIGGVTDHATQTADPRAAAAGLPPVDSLNQWGAWLGGGAGPRTELPIGTALGDSSGGGNQYRITTVQGLIQDRDGARLKLLLTDPSEPLLGQASWTGLKFPNASCPPSNCNCSMEPAPGSCVFVDCSQGCLFNLTADPGEHVDLSDKLPDVVKEMTARIHTLNTSCFSPVRGDPSPQGCATALAQGGFWGPFVTL